MTLLKKRNSSKKVPKKKGNRKSKKRSKDSRRMQKLRYKRGKFVILFCRLTGCDITSGWLVMDAHLAECAGISDKGFQDIRIGRRNIGPEPLERLKKKLAGKADFSGIEILTREGAERIFQQ